MNICDFYPIRNAQTSNVYQCGLMVVNPSCSIGQVVARLMPNNWSVMTLSIIRLSCFVSKFSEPTPICEPTLYRNFGGEAICEVWHLGAQCKMLRHAGTCIVTAAYPFRLLTPGDIEPRTTSLAEAGAAAGEFLVEDIYIYAADQRSTLTHRWPCASLPPIHQLINCFNALKRSL